MTRTIRLLDEHLANQIAAGEVVERPAAVIKELVENAIDADATAIAIAIVQGGMVSMRVTDNGVGIPPEQLELAFSRHATSKIVHPRDLFAIQTLGFRGEALPSIAAVADVVCRSATQEDGRAFELAIRGGQKQAVRATTGVKGTDIVVRELFFNTPARLKHLKTVQTELQHSTDYVYRLALSHPEIAFTLTHDGNGLLETDGRGHLLQTVAAVYGAQTAQKMIAIAQTTPDFTIEGYISPPDVHRAQRQAMTLIVNGRYVRMYAVHNALVQGYGTMLPAHRYPLAVVRVTMDPQLIDVNVHPAKIEVRCSKEGALVAVIRSLVQQTLRAQTLIPTLGVDLAAIRSRNALFRPQLRSSSMAMRTFSSAPSLFSPERTPAPAMPSQQDATQSMTVPDVRVHADARSEGDQGDGSLGVSPEVPVEGTPSDAHKVAGRPTERFPLMSVVGVVHGTYVVAHNDEAVYLIDQHAAHERVQYERIRRQIAQESVQSQPLLTPHVIELTSVQHQAVMTRIALLADMGIVIEPFGGYTILVRAHPPWMGTTEAPQIITDVLHTIVAEGRIDVLMLRDRAIQRAACVASVRAHETQTVESLTALLEQLAQCDDPFSCPHGRPTVVQWTAYELAKRFGRVP